MPNPPKDGDGKPRVLASSEKPRTTPRRTQDRRAAIAPVAITANIDVFPTGDCAIVRVNLYAALADAAPENTILLRTERIASSGVNIDRA